MNDKECLIRALAALGQCVPAEEREQLFGMMASWLILENSNCLVDTSSYFDRQGKDVRRAIKVVKAELTKSEYRVALDLLLHSAAVSNVLESVLQEQQEFEDRVQYVTTQPDFIRNLEGSAATAPMWGGTLLDAVRNLVSSAQSSVDIINPYWSKAAADQLLSGFDQPDVEFRVLTVLSNSKSDANWAALKIFIDKVDFVGSHVSVYSPTEEQIRSTDAFAPIHAKVIIQDKCRAYVGSANLSKGGLSTGLEIGLVHSGPAVLQLVEYCDWLFGTCDEFAHS